MPRYDFAYTTYAGEQKVVERSLKMSENTGTLQITDEDGHTYLARQVFLTPHANMATNWRVRGTDSTLPPEGSRALTQQEVPPTDR